MIPYPTAVRDFPVLRQSLLASVNECHLATAFDLRLSLNEPGDGPNTNGWSTAPQMRGRTSHHVLSEALTLLMESHEAATEYAPSMAVEAAERAIALRWSSDDELAALPTREMAQVRRSVRKWAKDNKFTVENLVSVEERLEVIVHYPAAPDDPSSDEVVERVLTGQPDALLIDWRAAAAVVIDWKDTWALPAKANADDAPQEDDDAISEEGYFQQRFYALLVFIHYPGVQSVTLREFYVRRSETREATVHRRQLPELVVEMAALAERFDRLYEAMPPSTGGQDAREAALDLLALLEDGKRIGRSTPAVQKLRAVVNGEDAPPLHRVWRPTPGAHCRFCDAAERCPLPRESRDIASPDEARAAGGAMLVGGRVRDGNRARLAEWCDAHGPVRIVDGKRIRLLGHVTATRTERPEQHEVDRAIAEGRDPRDLYVTKTHTSFRDYSPEWGDYEAVTDDEVAEAFEAAAAAAERRRKKRTAA